MSQNAEGKVAYRREQFEVAADHYRQAFQADPSMVAAEFNLACTFSRLHRHAEAAKHAANTIRRACVPWAREVFESADLAILASTPYWSQIEKTQKSACLAWGARAREGIYFIARIRPPVRVNGEGVLVLKLSQEVFSFHPTTGRYLQLTAEDGNVLALSVSRDNQQLAYLTGTKLIRDEGPPRLRGLAIRSLNLATMTLSRSVPFATDMQRISLAISPAGVIEVEFVDSKGRKGILRFDDDRLDPISKSTIPTRLARTVLTPEGVATTRMVQRRGGCRYTMKDAGTLSVPQVTVLAGKKPFTFKARYGAGLRGILFPAKPLPNKSSPPPRKK